MEEWRRFRSRIALLPVEDARELLRVVSVGFGVVRISPGDIIVEAVSMQMIPGPIARLVGPDGVVGVVVIALPCLDFIMDGESE